uniref:Store-operated calcium entry-associated regulatory factor n=1 Tax=Percolomonas cosmopolitus TaxID=63605 RepID=A0A7S1KQ91_9EUKA|mmetsp:Transcript_4937/g.18590  ORF Transcript_4937/g.18590 Transcript_4937/m.18590 type:complete len:211 (+) Transcript_4937:832-1464(+)
MQKSSFLSSTLFLLLVLLLSLGVTITRQDNAKRILESDITDLELSASRRAKCQRACPAPPQIQCNPNFGETCQHGITHAHCVNEGSDSKGHVKWRCAHNAHLKKVALSRVHISCEGWNGPDDDYVLDGSCALEYGLRWVERPSGGGVKAFWPLFVLAVLLSPCLVCLCLLGVCCVACWPKSRRGGYFRSDDVYGGDAGYGAPPPVMSSHR